MLRIVHVVVAVALLGVAAPSPVAAADEPVAVLQAGAVHPDIPQAPYEYTSYFPRGADGSSTIRVHPGDTVEWRLVGFHTVTFLPGGEAEHPVWVRADEAPGVMAPNERWWKPSDCGRPDQAACVIEPGHGFVSSGAPIFERRPFRVRFDLPASSSVRYHCTVHPDMHGTISVVGPQVALPSQTTIDARTADEVAADSAEADALSVPASSRLDGTTRVWRVLAGTETPSGRVQLLSYLGQPDVIAPGDAVEFVTVGQDPHTVTFPREAIGNMAIPPAPGPPHGTGGMRAALRCELDDPQTGLSGVPFPAAAVTGCPVGTLEITFAPWMVESRPGIGGAVPTPATYADSGLMLAEDNAAFLRTRPTTPPSVFPSTFRLDFPNRGTFRYGCNLHIGIMVGSVEVS